MFGLACRLVSLWVWFAVMKVTIQLLVLGWGMMPAFMMLVCGVRSRRRVTTMLSLWLRGTRWVNLSRSIIELIVLFYDVVGFVFVNGRARVFWLWRFVEFVYGI